MSKSGMVNLGEGRRRMTASLAVLTRLSQAKQKTRSLGFGGRSVREGLWLCGLEARALRFGREAEDQPAPGASGA